MRRTVGSPWEGVGHAGERRELLLGRELQSFVRVGDIVHARELMLVYAVELCSLGVILRRFGERKVDVVLTARRCCHRSE